MAWMRSAWIWAIVILALHPAMASAEDPQAPRTPEPLQAPAEARDSQSEPITLRVMTFNVWYGGEQVSFARVAEAIRLAEADIVGVQEPDGQLDRIAAAAGFPFIDYRRNIISRYPLFDSGVGERISASPQTYGIVALDPDALHAYAMVRPGEVVAVANTHLTSDPYGPHAAQGGELAHALAIEEQTRVPEAQPFAQLAQVAARGIPVFLTGDFNSPSPLDWTEKAIAARGLPDPVAWPATGLLLAAGLRDSFREAHPDPVATPGFTWTAGMPASYVPQGELLDRIDYVWTAGPTRTIASQIIGEPGGEGVDLALALYPSDHRAVVSTFSAIPAPAPALVAVEPPLVRAGTSFFLRAYLPNADRFTALVVPRGAGPAQALAGFVEETRGYRTGMRLGTDNLAPGGYDAIVLASDGSVAARSRFEVIERDTMPAIALAQSLVARGDPLRARWSDAPGFRHDWIGVFRAADPNLLEPLIWHYIDALPAGETSLALLSGGEPLPPGDYEARLMRDDSYTVLARAPFTITPP